MAYRSAIPTSFYPRPSIHKRGQMNQAQLSGSWRSFIQYSIIFIRYSLPSSLLLSLLIRLSGRNSTAGASSPKIDPGRSAGQEQFHFGRVSCCVWATISTLTTVTETRTATLRYVCNISIEIALVTTRRFLSLSLSLSLSLWLPFISFARSFSINSLAADYSETLKVLSNVQSPLRRHQKLSCSRNGILGRRTLCGRKTRLILTTLSIHSISGKRGGFKQSVDPH